jgi:hypothetical protein
MSGPTRRQIAEQDAFMVERQRVFRVVADRMAIALSEVDFVEKVALIGSAAAGGSPLPAFPPARDRDRTRMQGPRSRRLGFTRGSP